MAFIRRKLIIDPLYEVATQICKQYCDMITNPRGFCPSNCFSICDSSFSSSCKIHLPNVTLLSAPPPPPPENFKSPEESSHHHMEFSTGLVISILSTITVFSLLFCFMLYKCYRFYRSRRLTRESETGREDTHQEFVDEDHGFVMDHPIWYIRTVGLQPSVISAITICKYKKGEGLVEGTECSVCLNEFEEDETLRLLPKCNHAFHIPCIDTWLRSHTNCPLCRAGIVSMPAVLPVPEQRILDNSNVLEDSQVGVLGNNSENRGENEGVDSELRDCLRGQPRSQSERRNGIEKEEFGNLDQLEVNEVVQQMRRSVSLNFSCGEMAKGSDLNMGFVAEKRGDINLNLGSSSSGRSKEHFSMRRSFSYSGKVLFSRHNNSQSRS